MKQLNIFILLCLIFSACKQKVNKGETVIVDKGVEIPIKGCVEANSKILGNSVDPVAFCKCLMPKFFADVKSDPEKLKLLMEGNWYDLSKDKQELVAKYYENCMLQSATKDSSAKLTFSPRMFENMKKKMKKELIGSDIEKTNNVDKYCDCMLNSLQTDFTAKEVIQSGFNETEKFQKKVDSCQMTTKIN